MAKQQFTDTEQHVFNVAMGRRAPTGQLLPGTVGEGKGLSTNREENVVKHLVDPLPGEKRPSLADAALLIRLRDKHGEFSYKPFKLGRFLKLIRSAQQLGKKGDGRITVLWSPTKLAGIIGGAASNWTRWNRLALDISGRVSHPFMPLVNMSDLDDDTVQELVDSGMINESRTAALSTLTTTAMVAYLMAQSTWPEESLDLVYKLQKCVSVQADQFSVSVERPTPEPVADEGVEDILTELTENLPLPEIPVPASVPPPLGLEPKTHAVRMVRSKPRTAEDIRAEMRQLQAELAEVEKRNKRSAWEARVKEFAIESATPDDNFDLVSTLTVRVGSNRVMICGVLRVIEENILDTLQFSREVPENGMEGTSPRVF